MISLPVTWLDTYRGTLMNWGSEQWNVLASHLHPHAQESPCQSCQSTMYLEALWSFRVIWFPVMKHSETYSSQILWRPHSIRKYIYTAHKCIRYMHSRISKTFWTFPSKHSTKNWNACCSADTHEQCRNSRPKRLQESTYTVWDVTSKNPNKTWYIVACID